MLDMDEIGDLMANNYLLQAQGVILQKNKWIKKVKLPDDTVCERTHAELITRLQATAPPVDSTEYEFNQTCQIEPIGKRLFQDYCKQASAVIKQGMLFFTALQECETAALSEQKEIIEDIIGVFFKDNSLDMKYISNDLKTQIASHSGKVAVSGLDDIMQLLMKCRTELIAYYIKDVMPAYKESEQFKMYLKWKYLERTKVDEACFMQFRLLGRGGFGEVYAYQEKISGTVYACKKIDKKRLKMKRAENTVLFEKLILEKINSRFVVTMLCAYESKKFLNLVMTLLTGGDLKFHIYQTDKTNKGVNAARCKMYSAQIILGLEHLHKENILYRDLKPENVLLDNKGNCRIADMGLAQILQDDKKIKGKAGTLGFMAPEMLNNFHYAYSVDWFALGCTIFEMCEGQPPFLVYNKARRTENQEETIAKTKNTCESFQREHDQKLVDLIHKLLEKYVKDRLAGDEKSALPIMNHPYFENLNWNQLEAGLVEPPFVPDQHQVYATDVSRIRLASEVQGVNIDETDQAFYNKFSTGRNPVPWQQDMIDSGAFELINQQTIAGVERKTSKICTIL